MLDKILRAKFITPGPSGMRCNAAGRGHESTARRGPQVANLFTPDPHAFLKLGQFFSHYPRSTFMASAVVRGQPELLTQSAGRFGATRMHYEILRECCKGPRIIQHLVRGMQPEARLVVMRRLKGGYLSRLSHRGALV